MAGPTLMAEERAAFDGLVRDMVAADLDVVLDIIAAHDPALRPLAKTEIADGLVSELQRDSHYLVAELDGELVGVVGWIQDHFGVSDIRWLVWGYVHSGLQRRGIGEALFEVAEARLREFGIRKLYLDVGNADSHVSALAFHRKRGYIQEGYLQDFWADDDDLMIFGKRLR